jgi:hypothetical protein
LVSFILVDCVKRAGDTGLADAMAVLEYQQLKIPHAAGGLARLDRTPNVARTISVPGSHVAVIC